MSVRRCGGSTLRYARVFGDNDRLMGGFHGNYPLQRLRGRPAVARAPRASSCVPRHPATLRQLPERGTGRTPVDAIVVVAEYSCEAVRDGVPTLSTPCDARGAVLRPVKDHHDTSPAPSGADIGIHPLSGTSGTEQPKALHTASAGSSADGARLSVVNRRHRPPGMCGETMNGFGGPSGAIPPGDSLIGIFRK